MITKIGNINDGIMFLNLLDSFLIYEKIILKIIMKDNLLIKRDILQKIYENQDYWNTSWKYMNYISEN